jgi:hypothetical protein
MSKMCIWAPKNMRQMAGDMIWDWESSYTTCVIHILEKMGAKLIVSV